jgi:hypothetical protein
MENWRLKIEPWIVYRTVVKESHHFEVELDPDPQKVKNWIRIRIK